MHKKIRKRERKFFIKRNLEESGITAIGGHKGKVIKLQKLSERVIQVGLET